MAENPQPAWAPSSFWQVYADKIAQEGSDEQLRAVMTRSVPSNIKATDLFRAGNPHIRDDMAFYNEDMANRALGAGRYSASGRGEDAYLGNYARAMQRRLRDDFSKNYGSYFERGKANLRAGKKLELDTDLEDIDTSANSRGLLYSGKRLSKQQEARAQRANELGESVGDFERSLSDQRRQLENDAFQSDIMNAMRQTEWGDLEGQSYATALKRKLGALTNTYGFLGELGGGLGGGLGYSAGSKK